ncbi:hypothetical protein WJX72_010237 [[Myrmecia] bisecta]|uniref:CBM20 domain-containing protein n=1 Tax=[Myrmecia] bisecta TaxID=41462 RepID=A0AAW1R9T4_9CHLO
MDQVLTSKVAASAAGSIERAWQLLNAKLAGPAETRTPTTTSLSQRSLALLKLAVQVARSCQLTLQQVEHMVPVRAQPLLLVALALLPQPVNATDAAVAQINMHRWVLRHVISAGNESQQGSLLAPSGPSGGVPAATATAGVPAANNAQAGSVFTSQPATQDEVKAVAAIKQALEAQPLQAGLSEADVEQIQADLGEYLLARGEAAQALPFLQQAAASGRQAQPGSAAVAPWPNRLQGLLAACQSAGILDLQERPTWSGLQCCEARRGAGESMQVLTLLKQLVGQALIAPQTAASNLPAGYLLALLLDDKLADTDVLKRQGSSQAYQGACLAGLQPPCALGVPSLRAATLTSHTIADIQGSFPAGAGGEAEVRSVFLASLERVADLQAAAPQPAVLQTLAGSEWERKHPSEALKLYLQVWQAGWKPEGGSVLSSDTFSATAIHRACDCLVAGGHILPAAALLQCLTPPNNTGAMALLQPRPGQLAISVTLHAHFLDCIWELPVITQRCGSAKTSQLIEGNSMANAYSLSQAHLALPVYGARADRSQTRSTAWAHKQGRLFETTRQWVSLIGAVHHISQRQGTSRRATHTAAAASAPSALPVRIAAPNCELQFGLILKAVGNAAALGNWDLAAAPALEWSAGHNWSVDMQLPEGPLSFKLVITDTGTYTNWEADPNRSVEIPSSNEAESVELRCVFNQTTATEVVKTDKAGPTPVPVAEAGAAATAGQAPEAAAEVTQAQEPGEEEMDFPTDDSVDAVQEDFTAPPADPAPVGSSVAAGVEAQAETAGQPGDGQTDEQVLEINAAAEEMPVEEPSQAQQAASEKAFAELETEADPHIVEEQTADPAEQVSAPAPYGRAKMDVAPDGTVTYSFEEEEEEDASTLAQMLLGKPEANGSKPAAGVKAPAAAQKVTRSAT